MTQSNKWRIGVAVISLLLVVSVVRSDEDTEKTATATPNLSFPPNIAAMTCAELGAAHTQIASRLAAHVAQIRRGSWDAESGDRQVQSDPAVAEGQASLRTLNDYMLSC